MSKKCYYYILVFTKNGAKFVTSANNTTKYCEWQALEKPLDFSKEVAFDIALGLTCNLFNAVVVTSKYEIESQPYNYKCGQFEWVYNDK